MLKIKLIIFTPIALFIFSGCEGISGAIIGGALADSAGVPKVAYLTYGSLYWEPDLCEIAKDEDNILSTQTINLVAIKESKVDRETGDQLFLACLAKPKQRKFLVKHVDSGDKTYLVTWNVYGHANGYQTDDSKIIKNLAKKNCQRLLKQLISKKGYKGKGYKSNGILACRATCDMCRY
jgi:hypothetical protein